MTLPLSSCGAVFIVNGNVSSVAVTPANFTIAPGETQQFSAHVTFTDGATETFATDAVAWSTSNPSVATVSSHGLATGVHPGMAAITASVGSVSGSASLAVSQPVVPSVRITGGFLRLNVAFPATGRRILYIADAFHNTISFYRSEDGAEQFAGSVSVDPARGPVWMTITPAGRFLYVLNRESGNLSGFRIDPASGALLEIPGSPFADSERLPWTVSVDSTGQAVFLTHFNSAAISRFSIDPTNGALSPALP